MTGTTFTPGQLAELSHHVNVAAATALPQVVQKFDPQSTLKALSGRTEVLAGHLESALAEAIGRMLPLIPRGMVTVTLGERHDPDAYYRTRKGLWVYDGYRDRIVANAKPIAAGTTFKVNVDELGEDLTDEEIEAALSKEHCFDESAVCAIVAGMIEKQPGGKLGDLESMDRGNLLYMASCVVNVKLDSDNRKWGVNMWPRDDRRWLTGYRVLSPA